ncbi:fosfomycin resistance glutathione transferase [Gallaecimonas sp. GXIMD4217]|uniref:fosfomycin resistance glutathione transferase n=1 Tax=Gallaecimonas sp. GXIMD4217 TaxID=3131927 RepID=UPI00311B065E
MVTGLNHLTLQVRELDRSLDFYVTLLGMTPQVRWHGGAYLSAGPLWLCLSLGESRPSDDYSHIAFSVDAGNFEALAERLAANGIRHWQPNRSEGESLYILDPDGHKLEIHLGCLQSRLAALKEAPYPGLRWF